MGLYLVILNLFASIRLNMSSSSAMTPDQLNKVNGFSNQYWGWGGEDDDMAKRLGSQTLNITRYEADIARYTMTKHENLNKPNPLRHKLLDISETFQLTDGLVNLNYTLH